MGFWTLSNLFGAHPAAELFKSDLIEEGKKHGLSETELETMLSNVD